MTLWWLQPGWTDARCSSCGATIYPAGDPDWGECYSCFTARLQEEEYCRQMEEDHWRAVDAELAAQDPQA